MSKLPGLWKMRAADPALLGRYVLLKTLIVILALIVLSGWDSHSVVYEGF
jgi:hypothetical protein